jgi:hypothetical protein
LTEWDKVDQQSLILKAGPGDYYLLVLKIPSPELLFTQHILLSSSMSMIRAGYDQVILYGPGETRITYTIDRIYRMKSYQQMLTIKRQLTEGNGEDNHKNRPHRRPLDSI